MSNLSIDMIFQKRNVLCFVFFIAFIFFGNAQKFEQSGYASYYHSAFQGRYTSSGEIFDNNLYTAAHATLPFQTLVKITNLYNNKYVVVKINDRCPSYFNRIIDLSQAAAKQLDIIASGIANVKLEVITEEDLNYIFPCPDSLLNDLSSDSIHMKCYIFLGTYNLLPSERFLFGSIISGKLMAMRLKNIYHERQRFFAFNNMVLLKMQKFLS